MCSRCIKLIVCISVAFVSCVPPEVGVFVCVCACIFLEDSEFSSNRVFFSN